MTALLLSVGAAWAGPYEDGAAAYKRGDYAEAAKQYRLAAAQGDANGQTGLGLLYQYGKGVTQDNAEAVKWYRLAAAQGNSIGQSLLGWMYHKGLGVPQDYVGAYMWYDLSSASTGSPSSDLAASQHAARVSRDAVASLMTPLEIAVARKFSRECRQRNFKDCD